ncbi:fibronectin type III domain-containing protein [Leifsonia sp. NPDC058194]|uniref:fibronectin type III domain-containing protein n=1 Tax=Leifsonia sp. NPDC058194 TaxID=3346374 RepID=UPI0036DBE11A
MNLLPRRHWRRPTIVLIVAAVAAAAGIAAGTSASALGESEPLLFKDTTRWRYLDTNVDPGTPTDPLAWTRGDYDDSAWLEGVKGFGSAYGATEDIGSDYRIRTQTAQYVDDAHTINIPALFFRSSFDLTDERLADIARLEASVVYDDALEVYINGVKVGGANDDGVTGNLTYGSREIDAPAVADFAIDASVLRPGTNTVAVAVHQATPESPDVFFEFDTLWAVSRSAPSQISALSLQVGSDETQRNLTWYSDSGADEVVQVVPASVADAESFPAGAVQAFPSTSGDAKHSQQWHHSTVTGLMENTEYLYRVGSADHGWSRSHRFGTGTFSSDYHFTFVGDPQIGATDLVDDQAGWTDTITKADATFPGSSFILSAGDQGENAGNEAQTSAFLAPELMRTTPLATNIGNHDNESIAYRQHFFMPNIDDNYGGASAGEGSGGDYWFTYNDVLYLSLNTNNEDNANHAEFLRTVVAEHGAKARWKVVTFHQSVFSVADHALDDDTIKRRAELPPVFSELGIDFVLMGHDHTYTRTFLMNGSEPSNRSLEGTLTPAPGEVLYITGNNSSGHKFYDVVEDHDFDYVAVKNQEYVANVSNVAFSGNTVTFTTYRTTDMTEVDRITLAKAAPPVVDPPAETPGVTTEIAQTGSESGWVLPAALVALAAVATGVVAVLRRRRSVHGHS